MKKALIILAAGVAGYAVFLKVSEIAQRQATWHAVADPIE